MPILTVTNLRDSGAGALRQAILDANPGDTGTADITVDASGHRAFSTSPRAHRHWIAW